MRIKELKLKNFRNYEDLDLYPDPEVNLFFGRNGSGKTNLLEAIHYAALGRSHRISNDANVVRYGNENAISTVVLDTSLGQREIAVRFHPAEAQKKEILIDGKRIQKFSDMMGCLRCVIFSPEDLGLIREGPSVRRRYLDMMISQISRRYFIALQQYRTGMDQRNAILRNIRLNPSFSRSMLAVFEETMAGPAEEIIRERRRIVSLLSDIARDTYFRISGVEENLSISYHSSVKEDTDIRETVCRLLYENREDDIRLGMTSVGPHRDDFTFTIDGRDARTFGSQGQQRSVVLAWKMAEVELSAEILGEQPLLLLDDVMSELDEQRRAAVVSFVQKGIQTVVTTTNLGYFPDDLLAASEVVSFGE